MNRYASCAGRERAALTASRPTPAVARSPARRNGRAILAYFWVAVGGALGSMARFWLTGAMAWLTGPRFPWGTLLINVLGSLVIGLVAGLTLVPDRVAWHPDLRIFLMTGVCGGFTTFSSFSLQALELIQAGEVASAVFYATGSVALCLLSVWGGWLLGRL